MPWLNTDTVSFDSEVPQAGTSRQTDTLPSSSCSDSMVRIKTKTCSAEIIFNLININNYFQQNSLLLFGKYMCVKVYAAACSVMSKSVWLKYAGQCMLPQPLLAIDGQSVCWFISASLAWEIKCDHCVSRLLNDCVKSVKCSWTHTHTHKRGNCGDGGRENRKREKLCWKIIRNNAWWNIVVLFCHVRVHLAC